MFYVEERHLNLRKMYSMLGVHLSLGGLLVKKFDSQEVFGP